MFNLTINLNFPIKIINRTRIKMKDSPKNISKKTSFWIEKTIRISFSFFLFARFKSFFSLKNNLNVKCNVFVTGCSPGVKIESKISALFWNVLYFYKSEMFLEKLSNYQIWLWYINTCNHKYHKFFKSLAVFSKFHKF